MNPLSICQRIFDYTGHDNTKLHALAKTLGVAASTVSTWKARHTDPPAKYIMPIAEFLGVSPLWLLTGTPEPAAAQKSNTSFSLYDELHAVYDSLDRPGQVIMLAAGYREQLRVKGNPSQKIEAAPPRKFVLKINLCLLQVFQVIKCRQIPAFAV